ncbi:hypothetical protein DSO57_1017632 [Entomophthora muscae]|uniref:Uncharacterized protein n=1 Tax=Entomophthora muscae TaxID=34485 RepID=A0ACC2RVS9_9FUNG|nr:hypothetical protein DSO57_1017632 [Entomophthora muscae]
MASAYISKYELAGTYIEIVNVCPGFIPTTELVRDSAFYKRYILYYVFPYLSFTSTMEQGVDRVFKASTDTLTSPNSVNSPYTHMYVNDSWEVVKFEDAKIKELWNHVMELFDISGNSCLGYITNLSPD